MAGSALPPDAMWRIRARTQLGVLGRELVAVDAVRLERVQRRHGSTSQSVLPRSYGLKVAGVDTSPMDTGKATWAVDGLRVAGVIYLQAIGDGAVRQQIGGPMCPNFSAPDASCSVPIISDSSGVDPAASPPRRHLAEQSSRGRDCSAARCVFRSRDRRERSRALQGFEVLAVTLLAAPAPYLSLSCETTVSADHVHWILTLVWSVESTLGDSGPSTPVVPRRGVRGSDGPPRGRGDRGQNGSTPAQPPG
jgi:hypothetical protein